MNFEEINKTAVKLSKKEYKKLKKLVKNRSIFPHPSTVQYVKENKSTRKINSLIDFILDLSRFISVEHTEHEITHDYAMSNKYLMKSITAFVSNRSTFNRYLEETHKGNNMDGYGCSSFKYINNLYSENEPVYANKDSVRDTLTLYLKGKIPHKEYTTAYKKAEVKKNNNKKRNKLDILAREVTGVIKTKDVKNVKEALTYIKFKELSSDVISRIDEFFLLNNAIVDNWDSSLNTHLYKKLIASRSIKSLSKLKKSLNGNTIIYSEAESDTVGRIYNPLNMLDKYTRNYIFANYMELDIKNAAPNLIIQEIKERQEKTGLKFEYLDEFILFTKNKDDIIIEIQHRVAIRMGISTRSSQMQDIKIFGKQAILSYIFGSKLNVENMKRAKNGKMDKYEKATIEEVKLLLKESNLQIKNVLYKNSYMTVIGEVAKYLNVKRKELSHIFMKRETAVMKTVISILGSDTNIDNSIVHIHDGMLVPRSIIDTLSLNGYSELISTFEEAGVQVSNAPVLKEEILGRERYRLVEIYSKVVDEASKLKIKEVIKAIDTEMSNKGNKNLKEIIIKIENATACQDCIEGETNTVKRVRVRDIYNYIYISSHIQNDVFENYTNETYYIEGQNDKEQFW